MRISLRCAGRYSYYDVWNPCSKFTEKASNGNSCLNNGCQTEQLPLGSTSKIYSLSATKAVPSWVVVGDPSNGGAISMVWAAFEKGQDGKSRSMEVLLTCDPTQTDKTAVDFAYTGQVRGKNPNEPDYHYKFEAKGLCACPGKCNTGGRRPGSGGAGAFRGSTAALVILFAGIVLPYLVVGAVVQHRRGEVGRKLLIHREFWGSCTYLVKDGCIFSFRKVLGWRVAWSASSRYEEL